MVGCLFLPAHLNGIVCPLLPFFLCERGRLVCLAETMSLSGGNRTSTSSTSSTVNCLAQCEHPLSRFVACQGAVSVLLLVIELCSVRTGHYSLLTNEMREEQTTVCLSLLSLLTLATVLLGTLSLYYLLHYSAVFLGSCQQLSTAAAAADVACRLTCSNSRPPLNG